MFMGAAEAEQVPGAPAAAAQPAVSCPGSTVWMHWVQYSEKSTEVWLCVTIRARGMRNEFPAQLYCFGGSLLVLLVKVISEMHSHILS